MFTPIVSHPARRLVAAGLIAALGGCGGSSPDPLNEYRTQTVQWAECAPTILGKPIEGLPIEPPAGRLQCAQVRAPMDWSEPQRGDVFGFA